MRPENSAAKISTLRPMRRPASVMRSMLKPSTPPPSLGMACGANVPSTPTTSGFCCAQAPPARSATQAAMNSFPIVGLPKGLGAFYTRLMRALLAALLALPLCAAAQALPIFDAHLHYSHDAWELVPVPQAIEIMRKAGLKRALIS